MAKKTHGTTASGVPLTEEKLADLARRAEEGYDVDETLSRRRGRPPIGSAPASVESVRLEPELREALTQRAEEDDETHLVGDQKGAAQLSQGQLVGLP